MPFSVGGGGGCLHKYDGGGIFLACKNLGNMLDQSFATCAFFVVVVEVEVSSCALISLFMPGSVHSGSTS